VSQVAEYEAESWPRFEKFNEAVSFGPPSPYPDDHRLRAEQHARGPKSFSVFGHDAATTTVLLDTEVLVRTLLDELPGPRRDPGAEPPAIVGTPMRSPGRLDVVWEV
jgi:hypothetical protein